MPSNTSTFGQLDAGTPLVGSDIFAIQRVNGLNFKITADEIATFVGALTGITSINGDVTAAQVIAGGTGIDLVDAGATHTFSIDSSVVTLTGVQTLINKTLTSPILTTPTIASFVNSTHDHLTAAGGGTLTAAAISDFATTVTNNAAVLLNTAKVTNATHTGDVTGATALTIANNAVTLPKMADMATASFIGRITAATGDPEILSGTQATTLLNVFTSTLKGLVPLSGGGTTNFLRADGTFAAPPGSAPPFDDATALVKGSVDATKLLRFEVDGGTTAITGVIATVFTTAKTITIPDATDTLMGKATTDVMTNKSYALGGTGNALTGTKVQFNTAVTDGTFAFTSDNLSVFAATTSAQLLGVISDETGSGLLVFGTSPTIVTPTIASFVNATHNHQDAAGGGTLLSTSALSDTADIAYLNTTNAYIAGNRQDFLGLLAGTAGLNVGGIAGNPTTQVNGDIWLNSTSNTLFGRINGVNVDLGQSGGEVLVWTADHSMATFKLTATAANNVILNPPTGQNVEIQVNAIQEYLFGATTADFNGNGLSGLGVLSFDDTLTSIQQSVLNLQLDVATGGIFELRINNIANYTFGAFALDMISKRIDNLSQVSVNSGSVIRWGGTSTRAIFNDATGFIFKVPSVDTFTLEIATVAEFIFSASALDIVGNDIDNIQNLIHDISTSGTDIDFNEDELQTISIAVNTTFTTVNLAAGRSKTLKITTDATLRTFIFPGWDWVSDIPADQAASKDGYLTLTSYGTTDADVVAAYQVGSL